MRSTAALIAGLLPLQTLDDLLRPVTNHDLTQTARGLPADTAYQIVRTADRLGFEASDVLAEVVNAVSRTARSPKAGRRNLRNGMAAASRPSIPRQPNWPAVASPARRSYDKAPPRPQRQRPGYQHPRTACGRPGKRDLVADSGRGKPTDAE